MYDENPNRSILTDGRLYRSLAYLALTHILSLFYFTLLLTGFLLGAALSLVWVGLPLLALMFAASRGLAAFDQQLSAALLNTEPPLPADDLDLRGVGLMERLSLYLSSSVTWGSIGYLVAKFMLGTVTMTLASVALPFLILELVLSLFAGIRYRFTSRILYLASTAIQDIANSIVPSSQSGKAKRAGGEKLKSGAALFETEEQKEKVYFIGDDGEIDSYIRTRDEE